MKNVVLETQHNIDREQKLIELLGYHLIGPNHSNRWLILDENNNQVGFIQYKKLFKKNVNKGYPATFGYHIEIDGPKVSYKSTRKINNVSSKQSENTRFSYGFDIKRENGDMDHVEISMGECLYLNVWSKKYGFIDFKIDHEKLFLNFKSRTENFNIEELVVFQSDGENRPSYKKEYIYQIRYCSKELELSDDNLKGTTIREISGVCNSWYQESNQLELSEKTWINGKLRKDRKNLVNGTVEEMAMKHQMGIDSFHYFRSFINQILPFQQDVISATLSDEILKERGLSLFVSEFIDDQLNETTSDMQYVKRIEQKKS